MLRDGRLEIANLGDSGARLLRKGEVILSTEPLQHQFNMPFQLGNPVLLPETDRPNDAQVLRQEVATGDVLVLASDGFLDNVWDEELEAVVYAATGGGKRRGSEKLAAEIARELAALAEAHSCDKLYRSPWSVERGEQGSAGIFGKMLSMGGKVDDITVVVAFLEAGED
jgi:hypothetical protein